MWLKYVLLLPLSTEVYCFAAMLCLLFTSLNWRCADPNLVCKLNRFWIVKKTLYKPTSKTSKLTPLKITHPSEVAHSLEVDKVALAGVQRTVPVAVVGVIVAHSEGTGLWDAAGRQLGCVVVRSASGLRLPMGHRQWKTLLKPQLPLYFLHHFLFNNHLVCAVTQRGCAPLIIHVWY